MHWVVHRVYCFGFLKILAHTVMGFGFFGPLISCGPYDNHHQISSASNNIMGNYFRIEEIGKQLQMNENEVIHGRGYVALIIPVFRYVCVLLWASIVRYRCPYIYVFLGMNYASYWQLNVQQLVIGQYNRG